MKDYYDILGIDKESNIDKIKKTYRQLSMKYHPDKNKDKKYEELYKNITEAYTVLGNEEKKREYDMELTYKNSNYDIQSENIFDIFSLFSNIPKKSQFNNINENIDNMNMPKIYSKMYTNLNIDNDNLNNNLNNILNEFVKNSFADVNKPEPIEINLDIDIKNAYCGTNEPIKVNRWILKNNVKSNETETLYVNIHKGIDDKEIIILENKGNIINDNIKGDVKVYINIINETNFKREGLDLVYTKYITLKESLCGFSFDLEHLNGNILTFVNKKGNIITSKTVKVIKNQGITRNDTTGNLIIKFIIDSNIKLTIKQIEQIEKIL